MEREEDGLHAVLWHGGDVDRRSEGAVESAIAEVARWSAVAEATWRSAVVVSRRPIAALR